MKSIIVSSLLIVALVACKSTTSKEVEQSAATTNNDGSTIAANSQDDKMAAIDQQLDKLSRIESLNYSKEDGTSISAIAYMASQDTIAKVEVKQYNAKTVTNPKIHFYYDKGLLFASKKLEEKIIDQTAYFSEEVSFYNEKGEVIQSKERISDYEEGLINAAYKKINNVTHDPTEAFLVLKQQGPFAVTFQGFVDNGPYHFLIVGENVAKDGYTAALSIQKEDATIKYLRNEGKKALGKELMVQFVNHMDNQGYEMQILTDLALVERKKK